MARIIGIDLGSHSVKLSFLEGSFGRFQVSDFAIRPVPQSLDGPPSLEARVAVLGEMLADASAADRPTTGAGLPAEMASVRIVRLPLSDRSQIEKALPYELENMVPFDLEEMVISSRVLSTDDQGSVVLAAMAQHEDVGRYLSALKGAEIDPRLLAVDADYLSALVPSGTAAVVDIGHNRTLLSLVKDGLTLACRSVDMGGYQLTTALARGFGLDFATAEARKHQARVVPSALVHMEQEPEGFTDPRNGEVTAIRPRAVEESDGRVLADALAPLVAAIRATLVSFEDQLNLPIDEVVLCGGTSSLEGLRGWLQASLGVTIRLAEVHEQALRLGEPGRFGLAYGAALQAGARTSNALDLRQGDLSYKGNLATVGLIMRIGVLAVAATLLLGLGLYAFKSFSIKAEIADTDEAIRKIVTTTFPDVPADNVKDASTAVAIMQERTLATTSRVQSLGSIVADAPPTLETLRLLTETRSPSSEARIDVSELSISEAAINIKAETDGFEDESEIEAAWKREPRFENAEKGDEKKTGSGVRFTINIPLGDGTAPSEG